MTDLVAKTHQKELENIKQAIYNSHQYFRKNIDSFNRDKAFVHESTLSEPDKARMKQLKQPMLQFNVLGAYTSTLAGEFAEHVPTLECRPSPGSTSNSDLTDVVEFLVEQCIFESNQENQTEIKTWRDSLNGGFSAFKLRVDYRNNKSWQLKPIFERVRNPTMVGFDPMAITPTKHDGNYCYEIIPQSEGDLLNKYPQIKPFLQDVQFTTPALAGYESDYSAQDFPWFYTKGEQKIITVINFYKKKYKKRTLLLLSNGASIYKDQYEKALEKWDSLEAPPTIVDQRRVRDQSICRYKIIGNQVIAYDVMKHFKDLPLLFVDGNSEIIKNKQITRSYIHNAIDAQRLKNFLGVKYADEIVKRSGAQFLMPEECRPIGDRAWNDLQNQQVLPYKTYDQNLNRDIPARPEVIAAAPPSPLVYEGFRDAERTIQNILGAYDAEMGTQDKEVSGEAIVQAASKTSAASMPYLTNYIHALDRVGKMIKDMIPAIYTQPFSVTILGEDGNERIIPVNQSGGVSLQYDPETIEFEIKAGANFEIQKNRALKVIISLMNASEKFAEIINTKGLGILLDNIDIRGAGDLKKIVMKYLQDEEKAKAQQRNQPPIDPVAAAKLQLDQQQVAANIQNQHNRYLLDQEKLRAQVASDQQDYEIKQQEVIQASVNAALAAQQAQQEASTAQLRAETERLAKMADIIVSQIEHNKQPTQEKVNGREEEVGRET